MLKILLPVREFLIVLCGDVTKMFYQALGWADDADAYLFYYGKAPTLPELYWMGVHIFGAAFSPAICVHVLERAVADADPEDAGIALNDVKEHFFVDNSVKSESEALTKAESTAKALKRGWFELGQWGSSSVAVLAKLPGQPVAALNMDLKRLPTERTLSIWLDFAQNCFVLKAVGNPDCKTRCEIRRATASNFDPLGFHAPVILTTKLILQSICQTSTDWDNVLEHSILQNPQKWASYISTVNNLRIPQC